MALSATLRWAKNTVMALSDPCTGEKPCKVEVAEEGGVVRRMPVYWYVCHNHRGGAADAALEAEPAVVQAVLRVEKHHGYADYLFSALQARDSSGKHVTTSEALTVWKWRDPREKRDKKPRVLVDVLDLREKAKRENREFYEACPNPAALRHRVDLVVSGVVRASVITSDGHDGPDAAPGAARPLVDVTYTYAANMQDLLLEQGGLVDGLLGVAPALTRTLHDSISLDDEAAAAAPAPEILSPTSSTGSRSATPGPGPSPVAAAAAAAAGDWTAPVDYVAVFRPYYAAIEAGDTAQLREMEEKLREDSGALAYFRGLHPATLSVLRLSSHLCGPVFSAAGEPLTDAARDVLSFVTFLVEKAEFYNTEEYVVAAHAYDTIRALLRVDAHLEREHGDQPWFVTFQSDEMLRKRDHWRGTLWRVHCLLANTNSAVSTGHVDWSKGITPLEGPRMDELLRQRLYDWSDDELDASERPTGDDFADLVYGPPMATSFRLVTDLRDEAATPMDSVSAAFYLATRAVNLVAGAVRTRMNEGSEVTKPSLVYNRHVRDRRLRNLLALLEAALALMCEIERVAVSRRAREVLRLLRAAQEKSNGLVKERVSDLVELRALLSGAADKKASSEAKTARKALKREEKAWKRRHERAQAAQRAGAGAGVAAAADADANGAAAPVLSVRDLLEGSYVRGTHSLDFVGLERARDGSSVASADGGDGHGGDGDDDDDDEKHGDEGTRGLSPESRARVSALRQRLARTAPTVRELLSRETLLKLLLWSLRSYEIRVEVLRLSYALSLLQLLAVSDMVGCADRLRPLLVLRLSVGVFGVMRAGKTSLVCALVGSVFSTIREKATTALPLVVVHRAGTEEPVLSLPSLVAMNDALTRVRERYCMREDVCAGDAHLLDFLRRLGSGEIADFRREYRGIDAVSACMSDCNDLVRFTARLAISLREQGHRNDARNVPDLMTLFSNIKSCPQVTTRFRGLGDYEPMGELALVDTPGLGEGNLPFDSMLKAVASGCQKHVAILHCKHLDGGDERVLMDVLHEKAPYPPDVVLNQVDLNNSTGSKQLDSVEQLVADTAARYDRFSADRHPNGLSRWSGVSVSPCSAFYALNAIHARAWLERNNRVPLPCADCAEQLPHECDLKWLPDFAKVAYGLKWRANLRLGNGLDENGLAQGPPADSDTESDSDSGGGDDSTGDDSTDSGGASPRRGGRRGAAGAAADGSSRESRAAAQALRRQKRRLAFEAKQAELREQHVRLLDSNINEQLDESKIVSVTRKFVTDAARSTCLSIVDTALTADTRACRTFVSCLEQKNESIKMSAEELQKRKEQIEDLRERLGENMAAVSQACATITVSVRAQIEKKFQPRELTGEWRELVLKAYPSGRKYSSEDALRADVERLTKRAHDEARAMLKLRRKRVHTEVVLCALKDIQERLHKCARETVSEWQNTAMASSATRSEDNRMVYKVRSLLGEVCDSVAVEAHETSQTLLHSPTTKVKSDNVDVGRRWWHPIAVFLTFGRFTPKTKQKMFWVEDETLDGIVSAIVEDVFESEVRACATYAEDVFSEMIEQATRQLQVVLVRFRDALSETERDLRAHKLSAEVLHMAIGKVNSLSGGLQSAVSCIHACRTRRVG